MGIYDLMENTLNDYRQIKPAARNENWQVRYAAAIAIGQHKDIGDIYYLKDMLQNENLRPLYTQPRAAFTGSGDDTSMAEKLMPLTVNFERPVSPEELAAWQCRGRVKQACLYAAAAIGFADDDLLQLIHGCLQDDDYSVKVAAIYALGFTGNKQSLAKLKLLAVSSEWCTRVEAEKAISRLESGDTYVKNS